MSYRRFKNKRRNFDTSLLHNAEDALESKFTSLQSALDLYKQLIELPKDEFIKQELMKISQSIQTQIQELEGTGYSLLDLIKKFGSVIYKAKLIDSQHSIEKAEHEHQGEHHIVTDLVNNEAYLNERTLNRKPIHTLIHEISQEEQKLTSSQKEEADILKQELRGRHQIKEGMRMRKPFLEPNLQQQLKDFRQAYYDVKIQQTISDEAKQLEQEQQQINEQIEEQKRSYANQSVIDELQRQIKQLSEDIEMKTFEFEENDFEYDESDPTERDLQDAAYHTYMEELEEDIKESKRELGKLNAQKLKLQQANAKSQQFIEIQQNIKELKGKLQQLITKFNARKKSIRQQYNVKLQHPVIEYKKIYQKELPKEELEQVQHMVKGVKQEGVKQEEIRKKPSKEEEKKSIPMSKIKIVKKKDKPIEQQEQEYQIQEPNIPLYAQVLSYDDAQLVNKIIHPTESISLAKIEQFTKNAKKGDIGLTKISLHDHVKLLSPDKKNEFLSIYIPFLEQLKPNQMLGEYIKYAKTLQA